MSDKQELIAKYATDLQEKCDVQPDLALLEKVTTGLGPSIYNADASLVSGSDQAELDTVKKNFLIKKLGLADSPELDTAIGEVIEQYGKSNPQKHRAVVYYLLAKRFNKENIYEKAA